jgi:hypothetical protein
MATNLHPGDDLNLARTDRYVDLGLDASWQLFANPQNTFTANARLTHETRTLDASQALLLASDAHGTLDEARADASWYFKGKYGLTLGGFETWGSPDALLYAPNPDSRPDTSGLVAQVDYTPFGDGDSPLGKRFNLRTGLQYTDYFTFNGSRFDYDGAGRSAAANNTFRAFVWVYY